MITERHQFILCLAACHPGSNWSFGDLRLTSEPDTVPDLSQTDEEADTWDPVFLVLLLHLVLFFLAQVITTAVGNEAKCVKCIMMINYQPINNE